MPTADIIIVSDAVTRVVQLRERDKTRIISETSTISETVQAYKNGVELVPVAPVEIPTPQNIIGFRQRAVRIPRRPPRAIVIEAQLTNLIIAPLKLSDGINNKAIAGIRPRLVRNVALSPVSLVSQRQRQQAYASIKMQPEPTRVKAQLRLSVSSLNLTTAKLGLRAELQSIHALKAINFDKMYKLTRIMKVAMLAESL